MQLICQDNIIIELEPVVSPVTDVLQQMFKHLQRVPLDFKPWDNPYYCHGMQYSQTVDMLEIFANRLNLVIDRSLCLDKSDWYFNELHSIYQQNYDGSPAWLDFHEMIHVCQRFFNLDKPQVCVLDWRERAGLLIKDFNRDWLSLGQTTVRKGDVYVEWNELGKTPYMYWIEKEPHDQSRINELVKPWSKLRPKLCIALEDTLLYDSARSDEFCEWWETYEAEWCRQWGLLSWSLKQFSSAIVVYKISDIQNLSQALENQLVPVGIKT